MQERLRLEVKTPALLAPLDTTALATLSCFQQSACLAPTKVQLDKPLALAVPLDTTPDLVRKNATFVLRVTCVPPLLLFPRFVLEAHMQLQDLLLAQHARMDISVSQDRLRLLLPILCVLLDSIALTQAQLSLFLLALAEPTHLQLARLQTLAPYAVLDTSVLLVLLRWNLALQEPTALEATPTTFLERVAMESINLIS